MRTLIAMVAAAALTCSAACSGAGHRDLVYGAGTHAAVWTVR